MSAWDVVTQLPQWIGCSSEKKNMSMCCDSLAILLMQAIPKVGREKLEAISGKVEGMVSFRGRYTICHALPKSQTRVCFIKIK